MTNKRFEEWAGDKEQFNLYADGLKDRTIAEVAFHHGYDIGQRDFRARVLKMLNDLEKHVKDPSVKFAAEVIEKLVIE